MARQITDEEAKKFLGETPEADAAIREQYKLRAEKVARIKAELLALGLSEEAASGLSKASK